MVRAAILADIPAIMDILETAKASLKGMGLDQWQYGYPNQGTVEDDIAAGAGFVLNIGHEIAGYMALCVGAEPGYERIFDGGWLLDADYYATVHRVALSEKNKGQGLSGEIMRAAEDLARSRGCLSIRVDTHPGNTVMQRMLGGQGYTHCGQFCLPDGEEAGALRWCYEKLL